MSATSVMFHILQKEPHYDTIWKGTWKIRKIFNKSEDFQQILWPKYRWVGNKCCTIYSLKSFFFLFQRFRKPFHFMQPSVVPWNEYHIMNADDTHHSGRKLMQFTPRQNSKSAEQRLKLQTCLLITQQNHEIDITQHSQLYF